MSDDYQTVSTTAPYAEVTQKIANGFPDWHAARRQRESVTHNLLNAVVGIPVTQLRQEVSNFRRQVNILTADTNRNYKAFEVDISQTVIRTKKFNLLRNSNFSNWSNPAALPDYWNISATENAELVTSIYGDSSINYLGGYSLIAESQQSPFISYGQLRLYQEYVQPSGADIRTWRGTMYYRRVGTDVVSNNKFGLFLKLLYDDGTTTESLTVCTDTQDWKKLTASITATKRVNKVQVGFINNDPLNTDLLYIVAVNNFMLQNTLEDLPWCRHLEDAVPGIPASSSNYCAITTSRSSDVFSRNVLTELTVDFDTQVLPTSVKLDNFVAPVTQGIILPASPIQIESSYLQDKSVWNQSLVVANETVRKQYGWANWTLGRLIKFNPNSPQEIFATYKPAFQDILDPTVSYLVNSLYVTCVTEFNGRLWLIARLTQGHTLHYASKFSTVLMVIDKTLPKQPTDLDEAGVDLENDISYLPIIRSYMLNATGTSGFGLVAHGQEGYGGNPTADGLDVMQMVFTDFDKVQLTFDLGYKATLDLSYDYFTVDAANKKLYTYRNYVLDNSNYSLVIC